MKKVFVNGYGFIGSRITSFLKDDPEITVFGVGKYSPDEKVDVAISRGLNVYVPERKLDDFSNYKISGTGTVVKQSIKEGSFIDNDTELIINLF